MLIYRILLTFISPLVVVALLVRVLKRRETWNDIGQRLGGGDGQTGALWLHGASNGELTSARALIEALMQAFPDRRLVVTANTTTGRDMVAGWAMARVTARLAPLDLRPILARFRACCRPVAQITLENELWPNRIGTADEPVFAVAARLSQRSLSRWQYFPGLAGRMLARIDWLSPQDDASGPRFVALGLDPARLGPVAALKPGIDLPPPPPTELARLRTVFHRPDTLLAASTHDGEEALILQAFIAARAKNPDLKLILAPRHPRRGDEIAGLIAQTGLSFSRRTQSGEPCVNSTVYLADTLGEMPLWYALAGITFVGGSLVTRGGHTPFEPVQAASAILHGPHVSNFEAAYAALGDASAALCFNDAKGLASGLQTLASEAAQIAQASRAKAALARFADDGAIPEIVARLRAKIDR